MKKTFLMLKGRVFLELVRTVENAYYDEEAKIFAKDKGTVVFINGGTFYFKNIQPEEITSQMLEELGEHCILDGEEEVSYKVTVLKDQLYITEAEV
jgi:hypothetical protein